MNTNKKIYSVIFTSLAVILFLILVSSAASAASSPKITETQITTNLSNSEHPAIYGNTIVWQDDRNGNSNIYICTLTPADIKPHSPVSNAYESGLNLISQLLRLN